MRELPENIKTNRLTLRPYSEKFITARYLNWLNDPKIMRFSEQRHKVHTYESCRAYLQTFQESTNTLWAIEEKLHGHGHIGNISAYIDLNNKIADIGILIGESYAQGQGYGYEAFKGVVEYLFKYTPTRKITAGTVSANIAMIEIMHKMKMKDDGVRRRHYLIDGNEVDVIYMALFKDDKMGQ
ncbi:MAG: GNAT family protein [Thermodesulfobacteriota bacterium]|nr:GNAT family protein [Thermodesulfobacteriota bacterium]